MITLTFSCGGCDKVEPGTRYLQNTFTSFSGKSHGLGTRRKDTPEDVAPEGWIAFDPYTQCTYCPKCWAEIEESK